MSGPGEILERRKFIRFKDSEREEESIIIEIYIYRP
jgi:hypothetical protein